MHPERDCCGGQRRPDRSIAAWRKGPVERCANVIDFPGAISQPFDRGPRCRLTLGALENVAIILGVAARNMIALAALAELLERTGTGRAKEPKSRVGPTDIGDDQRFRHQIGQPVYGIRESRYWLHGHGCCSLDGEATCEDPERPEERLLVLVQQAVAPIDDGPHRR